MKGRVLIIAGSDPSGGAGLQADIKTVTALGGYAAAAVTALTVQNTQGVSAVHPVAPDIVAAQIEAVMEDIGADAIKIGMIAEKETAQKIAALLFDYRAKTNAHIVLDPVLVATSGDALAGEGVAGVIYRELMPMASIVTPNTEELSALTGVADLKTSDDVLRAGKHLLEETNTGALLLKGGHLSGEHVTDFLLEDREAKTFRNPRIHTKSTHGTGCTLASAAATGLAQGMSLAAAVERAIAYVHKAIETAPGFGSGHGPLNHGHMIKPD